MVVGPKERAVTGDFLGLEPERVQSQQQAWLMAQIRNVGRLGFSHDDHEITRIEQAQWWGAHSGRVEAWLFREDVRHCVVGYGMLRPLIGMNWTTSVTVLPAYTGRGYGKAILRFLVRNSRHPLLAEALRENEPAVRLHDEEYWEPAPSSNGHVRFRARREHLGSDLPKKK